MCYEVHLSSSRWRFYVIFLYSASNELGAYYNIWPNLQVQHLNYI